MLPKTRCSILLIWNSLTKPRDWYCLLQFDRCLDRTSSERWFLPKNRFQSTTSKRLYGEHIYSLQLVLPKLSVNWQVNLYQPYVSIFLLLWSYQSEFLVIYLSVLKVVHCCGSNLNNNSLDKIYISKDIKRTFWLEATNYNSKFDKWF